METPLYAMLLAAGFGTRLKKLSAERPKPMLPVCNYPLVRWAASWCVGQGIKDLVVNMHHLGDQLPEELGDGSTFGAKIIYSPEKSILGTGGGVKTMAGFMPKTTCLVMNAKIITDLDLAKLLAFHRKKKALATMVLYPDPQPEKWGAIGVDDDGQIVRLLKMRRENVSVCHDYMFTGIHMLEPEMMNYIPDGESCIIRTAYTRLFAEGARLAGFVHQGYFHEHSTPERYFEGNMNLLYGRASCPYRPGPLRGIAPSAQVDADVQLVEPYLVGAHARISSGVTVGPGAIIGQGAFVAAGLTVSNSVIWPEAMVSQSHDHSIVTPQITIPVSSMTP